MLWAEYIMRTFQGECLQKLKIWIFISYHMQKLVLEIIIIGKKKRKRWSKIWADPKTLLKKRKSHAPKHYFSWPSIIKFLNHIERTNNTIKRNTRDWSISYEKEQDITHNLSAWVVSDFSQNIHHYISQIFLGFFY